MMGLRGQGNRTVSIVMPAYNAESTIKKSIESVLSQTYEDWELIIVDDSSTDKTVDLIKAYVAKDERITLVTSNVNNGVVKSRNAAIKKAGGRYIAFLDSDDYWTDDKLSLQVQILINTSACCTHSSYYRFTSEGVESMVECLPRVTRQDMLSSNKIGNLTGVYDVHKVGKKFQKEVGHEDYLMWLDVLNEGFSIGVKKPLAYYRVSSLSLSSNKVKAAYWHYLILKNEVGLSGFQLIKSFATYFSNSMIKRLKKK